MHTQKLKIAGLTVEICCESDFSRLFEPYTCSGQADISVGTSAAEITYEQGRFPALTARSAEFCLLYAKICDELPRFDAFMLHAAVLEYNGMAYAFCAKSGTGKSTHAELWCSLPDKGCRIINGDKPIIRITDGIPNAFGTPWNGKEGRGENISAPLAGIGFIVRDDIPSVRQTDKKEGLFRVLSASHRPKEHSLDDHFYQCVGQVAKTVPMYELKCNVSADAAKTAFEAMTGEML